MSGAKFWIVQSAATVGGFTFGRIALWWLGR